MSRNLSQLPLEIIDLIVQNSDVESVGNLCATNQMFAQYCKDPNGIFWKLLLDRYFP